MNNTRIEIVRVKQYNATYTKGGDYCGEETFYTCHNVYLSM